MSALSDALGMGSVQRHRLLLDTLVLLRVFARSRWTAKEAAEVTGLHARTVYRVLAAMRGAGLRLTRQVNGSKVYWRLHERALADWLWDARLALPSPTDGPHCRIVGCPRRRLAHGLCSTHNARRASGRPLRAPVRTRRNRTPEEVRAAILLARKIGIRPAARRLGMSRQAIQKWMRRPV